MKSLPFRTWYGNLGELRSVFDNISFVVCTATATLSTKRKIFDVLCLSNENTFVINISPERENLKYSMQYVDNSLELSAVFDHVINEVRQKKQATCRTIIYCKTRKQCAVLWRIFKLQLGGNLYVDGNESPKNCMVQMFHAGTSSSAKSLILNDILQIGT